MKLNTFTNPVIQTAQRATAGTSSASDPGRLLTRTRATRMPQAACAASRRPGVSPRMSSANPSRPKAATAQANTVASAPPIRTAATSRPTTTGMPPPRGVGTVWEDR